VTTSNFPDAVVWNAWEKKAAGMADMEQDGWHRYVCLEPAIINRPVQLDASQTSFTSSISLSVLPL
jgi:glucose-6-phosphate 1-epimerase